jgi:hypothetical protein
MNKIELNPKLTDLINRINGLPDETLPEYNRGIYFLFNGGKLVYIGKSEIGVQRILQHKDKEFDSYKFLDLPEYSKTQILEFETILIAIFNPPYNRQMLPIGLQKMVEIIEKL